MAKNNSLSFLLVITGGIAAYKSLELIRTIRKAGHSVRAILTKGGEQFVTPMSVSALCEQEALTELWSLKDETEMGHIRLSREADVILIAPASADFIAKMAHGHANDLASTTLLAANKPIYVAPAMNVKMWEHPATQRNLATIQKDGAIVIDPTEGEMACGEFGMGRMCEPEDIFNAVMANLKKNSPLKSSVKSSVLPLAGKKALVTSGPTFEPIDPVRFIGNRSSGKQGHAIATALAKAGADVTLISGPVALPDPEGVQTIHVETAHDMFKAVQDAGTQDIAICAAAVSDWKIKDACDQKIKKTLKKETPSLSFEENPDILAWISQKQNPRAALVIGFAAETENVLQNGRDKFERKGCDWLLINDVSENKKTGQKTFGADTNQLYLLNNQELKEWPIMAKSEIADRLAREITDHFKTQDKKDKTHEHYHNAAE